MFSKRLLKSEKEFRDFVDAQNADRVNCGSLKDYPPESYPCIIAFHTTNESNSMRWAENLDCEFIYPYDFTETSPNQR